MLPKDLTHDLKSRLNMLAGQLQGIGRMLDAEDIEPDQVLVQFKAVTNGLSSAEHLLLDEVFRKGLALQIVNVVGACPGDCQDAGRIEQLRREFPANSAAPTTGAAMAHWLRTRLQVGRGNIAAATLPQRVAPLLAYRANYLGRAAIGLLSGRQDAGGVALGGLCQHGQPGGLRIVGGTDADLVALREALRAYELAHPATKVGAPPRRR